MIVCRKSEFVSQWLVVSPIRINPRCPNLLTFIPEKKSNVGEKESEVRGLDEKSGLIL